MNSTDVLGMIGNTPLVQLDRITEGEKFEILAKAEYLNPSGSLKDRIALRMIEDAETQGHLRRGGTIVEASTGNTAIAVAMVGRHKGYNVIIYLPADTAVEERVRTLKMYGAEVRDASVGTTNAAGDVGDTSIHGGYIEIAGRIMCRDIERQPDIWWARQFSSTGNSGAHRDTTGREILQQVDGKIDAVVASVGTGGTFVGLREAMPEPCPLMIAVEPAGHAMLSRGLDEYPLVEGITDGFVLQILRENLADQVLTVKDEEAIDMTRRLHREEGLFCGISSGANVLAALRVGRESPGCKRIVTVLPDSYQRYMSCEHYVT